MKSKKIIMFLWLNSMIVFTHAQSENNTSLLQKHKKIKLSGIKLGMEFYANNKTFGGYENIMSHTPSGEHFQKNYPYHDWGYVYATTFFFPAISISFHPYSQKKGAINLNQEISIGFSLAETEQEAMSGNDVRIGYDTIVQFKQKYQEIIDYSLMELAYLYKSDPHKRFSYYIGMGIKGGFSVRSDLYVTQQEEGDTLKYVVNYSAVYWENGAYQPSSGWEQIGNRSNLSSKTYPTSRSWMLQPYIPVGVNFRVSEKGFFSHLFLSLEAKAGINYQKFKIGHEYINPFCSISVGLRYNFAG